MQTFEYFFGTCLLHSILRHTNNLSKTMQHTIMSAAEAQHLAAMTVTTLQVSKLRKIYLPIVVLQVLIIIPFFSLQSMRCDEHLTILTKHSPE